MANYLANVNYTIHIIFLKEEGGLIEKLDTKINRWDVKNGRLYFSVFKIRNLVKNIDPDIIFPWMGYLNAYLAFCKPLFADKIVWLCRESTIPSLMNPNYRFPKLYSFFYKFYNRYSYIICQSGYMAKDLEFNFNIKKERLVVINNPVDFEKVTLSLKAPVVKPVAPENSINLLYVGSLNKWKRVHLLIEALILLPENYYLTIVGNGTEYENIQAMTIKNNISGRIRFILDCNNPYPYYAASNCLLLCSEFEGFPNVALESMASGCPVIGFNIKGGANEILENYGGFIVPGDMVSDFAKSILNVCEKQAIDKDKIIAFCKEKYDLKKIMGQYQSVITG